MSKVIEIEGSEDSEGTEKIRCKELDPFDKADIQDELVINPNSNEVRGMGSANLKLLEKVLEPTGYSIQDLSESDRQKIRSEYEDDMKFQPS